MTLEMWRILTVVCAALSVVFAIVAIIVYKALRIKQAKLVLSGADAASEIQKLRSSRVGTWLNPVPRGRIPTSRSTGSCPMTPTPAPARCDSMMCPVTIPTTGRFPPF